MFAICVSDHKELIIMSMLPVHALQSGLLYRYSELIFLSEREKAVDQI